MEHIFIFNIKIYIYVNKLSSLCKTLKVLTSSKTKTNNYHIKNHASINIL